MFERSFKKRKKENIFEFFAFEEKSTISLSRIHRYSNFRYWKETRSFDTFDLILKENGIIYSRSTHEYLREAGGARFEDSFNSNRLQP